MRTIFSAPCTIDYALFQQQLRECKHGRLVASDEITRTLVGRIRYSRTLCAISGYPVRAAGIDLASYTPRQSSPPVSSRPRLVAAN